jgi:hypothetical protein
MHMAKTSKQTRIDREVVRANSLVEIIKVNRKEINKIKRHRQRHRLNIKRYRAKLACKYLSVDRRKIFIELLEDATYRFNLCKKVIKMLYWEESSHLYKAVTYFKKIYDLNTDTEDMMWEDLDKVYPE